MSNTIDFEQQDKEYIPKNRYEFQDAIAFAADFEAPMAIRYPKTDAVRVLIPPSSRRRGSGTHW